MDLISHTDSAAILVSSSGVILGLSLEAERLFGYRASELNGESVSKVLPGLATIESAPRSQPLELVGTTKSTTDQNVSVTLTQFSEVPPVYWLAIQSESETELAELRHPSNVSESALDTPDASQSDVDMSGWTRQEMDRIGYALSHDMRAPLRAVRGFSEILSRSHQAGLSEQASHYLQNVLEAGSQLDLLLNDLVTYVRCGRQLTQLRDVNLNELFQKLKLDLQPVWSASDAHLRIAANLPTVRGDWGLLIQAFKQILTNAAAYRRPHVAPRILVEATSQDGNVVISIKDNGIGIDPVCYESVFQLFQRLVPDDGANHSGAGLAIARKAIELLGGRIWLDSTVSVGSTFFVALEESTTNSSG